MKPMLDNDIDNLFKPSLESYEIRPSAESWQKINSQLERKQGKNNQPYWLAAASVILVVGLGFNFFGTQQEVIKLTANSHVAIIEEEEVLPVEHKITVKQPVLKELSLNEVKMANEKHFLSLMAKTNIPSKKNRIKPKGDDFKNKNILASAFLLNVDKSIEEEAPERRKVKVAANTVIDAEDPILATAQQTKNISAFNKELNYSEEKSIIKSVGDLVNFVIAKVDNREQKLLHMSRTEESDMEITQINLGLIKYKKN